MSEQNNKPARVCMKPRERYQLLDRLRAEKAQILRDRPTLAALCDRLTRELGFHVNSSALKDAIEFLEMEWTPARLAGPKSTARKIYRMRDILMMMRELTRATRAAVAEFGSPTADFTAVLARMDALYQEIQGRGPGEPEQSLYPE